MNRNNNPKIRLLIEEAKDRYMNLPTKTDEVVPTSDWEVPGEVSIFTDFAEVSYSNKSIIKEPDKRKLSVKKNIHGKLELSMPEQGFIEELDRTDDDVLWWFKNSYGESKYFGIAYKNHKGFHYAFYPDFIIKTKKETLIVEIKDDRDFKPENLRKLQAGREYLRNHEMRNKEKLRFYMLSPNNYPSFFRQLRDQEIDKFRSIYELNLVRFNKSQQVLIGQRDGLTKDEELLEYVEELDKAINQIHDLKERNALLEMQYKEALENVRILLKT